MILDTRLKLLLVLAGVFSSSLLLGDLIGAKLIEATVFGQALTLSVGIIPFPITFLLTDLLNEFYGKRAARTVTWVGFALTLFTFAILTLVLALPFAPFTFEKGWDGLTQQSFDAVFGGSRRILISSLVAYLLSQFLDIAIFNALKRKSHNRHLWLRATGSTVVSQLVDTAVIQSLAWAGTLPTGKIVSLIITSYLVKVVVAIGLTPVIYFGHALVTRLLKLEPVVLDEDGEPVTG